MLAQCELLTKNIKMEEDIEKKIKDLKEFIRQKIDQGIANYLGKEITYTPCYMNVLIFKTK